MLSIIYCTNNYFVFYLPRESVGEGRECRGRDQDQDEVSYGHVG